MNKTLIYIINNGLFLQSCRKQQHSKRIPVAEGRKVILYYDEIPEPNQKELNEPDSAAIIQNYINKWAKRRAPFAKS